MWADRLSDFVTLLLVVNPLGVLPVFVVTVGTLDRSLQREIAVRAVVVATVVLLFFMFLGNILLAEMGVSVRAFQIAGGIILFLVALEMVREDEPAIAHSTENPLALAIYPIGIPKIAGPGAMLAVMLLIGDDRYLSLEQLATVGVLVLVMAITLATLLLAAPISRVLGEPGIGVIRKVMGLLLVALAVNMILTALVEWLGLPKL
jgi:multiple antibiotic resistance protein